MKTGIVCGAFDLIHPGYIDMFRQAKLVCDKLIVALQTDPTLDRPNKMAPIHTVMEREIILKSIRYVDDVIIYSTESSLIEVIQFVNPDVRILGSDYRDKAYTGDHLDIPVFYVERYHNWSTSDTKNKISNKHQEK